MRKLLFIAFATFSLMLIACGNRMNQNDNLTEDSIIEDTIDSCTAE